MRPVVKRKKPVPFWVFDRYLMIAVFVLLAIGIIMVTSASMAISERQFGEPFHYLFRQVIYVGLGVGLASLVVRIKLEFWEEYSYALLLIAIFLLIVVAIPGIGHSVNGSRRWLSLGIIQLQVSEFVKLAVVVYLGSYLVRHAKEVQLDISGFMKPMVLLGVIAVLLLLEPDFGAVVVVGVVALSMMYMAGVRLWQFAVLLLLVAAAMAFLAISSPYRVARLTAFLNPWQHQFNSGYQLTQSLIAFGRGGFFGVGLGSSIQKLFYLPEAHTDFLFAVLGEELGLLGMLCVVALYVLACVRIFLIGRRAQYVGNHGAGYMAYGIAVWIGMQAIVNMGVNSGLLPTKGLTLPFMSYGGSSMLITFAALAIIFRIDYETRMGASRAKTPKRRNYHRVRHGI